FDSERFDELDGFLAEPGPREVPEPERVERYERAAEAAGVAIEGSLDDHAAGTLADALGVETAYAILAFARRHQPSQRALSAIGVLAARLPGHDSAQPYVEPELAILPRIAKPKVAPKRLSTG